MSESSIPSIKVPPWALFLIGGGGLALGGGGLTVGAKQADSGAIEARVEALEEDAEVLEAMVDRIADNQLLICAALDVDCER